MSLLKYKNLRKFQGLRVELEMKGCFFRQSEKYCGQIDEIKYIKIFYGMLYS